MKRPGLKRVFSAFFFFIILLINLYANIEPGDPAASPSDLTMRIQQPVRHTCRFKVCSGWTDNGAIHYRTRNCSQCVKQETEVADHSYNTWSAWSSTGAYHTRARHCSVCGHMESETVAHDFSAWSAWQDLGDNHYRYRVCAVCGKKETETSAHSYGGWSAWSVYTPDKDRHLRTRTCFLCRHTDREAAAHLAYDNVKWQAVHSRNKQHFTEH